MSEEAEQPLEEMPPEQEPPQPPLAPPAAEPPPLPPDAPQTPSPDVPQALPPADELPGPIMSAQVPEVRGEQVDPPPPTRNSELDPLRDQIEQLQARVRTPLEFASIFVAKITGGNSDDGYNWIEQVFNAGDFEDFTDGRQGDNADTDYFPPTPIDPNAVIQVDNLYVFMELLDPAGGQYVYAIMTGGGGTIAFKITSATATQGLYNAKSVAMGTATISSYGTLAAEEDLFVWNGAETAIATANNLLLSPNTSTFDVVASGTVVGVDAGSGKKIVIAWIGYAGCTSA